MLINQILVIVVPTEEDQLSVSTETFMSTDVASFPQGLIDTHLLPPSQSLDAANELI